MTNTLYTKYLLIAFLLFAGCKETSKPVLNQFSGVAMTMEWRAQIAGPIKDPQEIERIIERSFREVNQLYNRWNPLSEISKLNRLPAKVSVPISSQLASFINFTETFVNLSEGRFDPTIEPLQQLWKSKLVKNEIPSNEEISELLPAIGWDKFQIKDGSFTKSHSFTAFDLGGVAKGFAVDLVAERLKEAGYNNVYFEWGGEIRALGQHPEGRPWIVWIARLKNSDPREAIDLVKLEGEGIATSGDYEQFWVIRHADGSETTYFHVLNPKTGRPLVTKKESIASVSVVAPTCAIADALATSALMFSNLDEAEAWAKKVQETYPTVKFWFVKH